MEPQKIDWWFWTITFVFIMTALFGWIPGYYLVILISAVQIVYFGVHLRNLFAFDTQVRIVYFLFTLLGLFESVRFPFYILLLIGTFMVVFLDRCGIALALKYMPWNKRQITNIQF